MQVNLFRNIQLDFILSRLMTKKCSIELDILMNLHGIETIFPRCKEILPLDLPSSFVHNLAI
jgi:hypothetical protein